MQHIDDFLTKHFYKVFWILSGIFLVLYLILTGGDNIWTDESYSFAMVKHSFSEIFRITAADVHPPFYYWYLKILIAPFKYSMLAAKIASILPFMFIIVFGGMQLKKCFNERTAVLFMGMFFCYPFTLSYSVEIRMYSLAAAFVFSCAVFAYRLWQEDGKIRYMIGLIVSGTLAAYTHYFAFVSVCVIYGLLLIAVIANKKKLLIKWLLSVVCSVILYMPWISSFVSQLEYKANNEYWIGKITKGVLLDYCRSLFGANGFTKYAWFFSLSYLICFIWILRSKTKKDILICICCLLIPIGTLIVGVLASIIVRPVFMIRYLIPSVPLLVTFMAIVLGKLNNDMLFGSILTIVLVGGIINYGTALYSEYTKHNYLPVEEYADVDAYIVLDDDSHVAGTLGYYITEKNIYYGDYITAANPYPNLRPISDLDADNIDKAIMMVNIGETPSDVYYDMYDIKYLGQWKCESDTDVFLLQKRIEK